MKAAIDLKKDILAKQETLRTSTRMTIRWKVGNGYGVASKKEGIWSRYTYGPSCEAGSLQGTPARIIWAKLLGKNLSLVILNLYAPTDATEYESTKNKHLDNVQKTRLTYLCDVALLCVRLLCVLNPTNALHQFKWDCWKLSPSCTLKRISDFSGQSFFECFDVPWMEVNQGFGIPKSVPFPWIKVFLQ